MDLGEIGVILVAEGEAEARAAIERFVRARDSAVRSMDEAAQREVRAAEAIERAIQREIREYENLVKTASSLERAYEDLVASFNPLNRAQLQYARNIEMLDAALESNVINEQQRARAMELLRQRMESAVEAEKTADIQRMSAAMAENTREIQNAQAAYDRLLGSMDPVLAANQKYERGIDVLNMAEAKRVITVEERLAAEKRLEAQLAKDITSAQAAQSRRSNQELDRSKQAHAALVGELDRLRASTNVQIRQQQLYDQAIKTTTRAVKARIISEQEAGRVMEDVRQKMASMGHVVNQNGEVMSRADTAYQRWARGGLQNAGYQVADFAVQVQGGTSAVVAFGQQAPQLLGTFGAAGAVAGAFVAIGAGLVNYFIRASGEGRKLSEVMGDLTQSIDDYAQSAERLRDEDLALEFGNMTSEVQRLTRATIALDRASALANLSASIKALVEETTELDFGQSVANRLTRMFAGVEGMSYQLEQGFRSANFGELGLGIGYDVFRGMMGGITASANRGDVEATARQLTDMIQQAMPDGLIDAEGALRPGAALLIQYRDLTLAAAELAAEINGSADETERLRREAEEATREAERAAQAAERERRARERAAERAAALLTSYEEQAALQREIALYGENSAQVEELKAQQAERATFALIDALDVSGDVKNSLYDAYQELVSATGEASRLTDEAARTKAEFDGISSALRTIQGQISSLNLSNVGREARLAALQGGESELRATASANVAMRRAELAPALGSAEGAIRTAAQQQLDDYIAAQERSLVIDEQTNSILDERRAADRETGGSGDRQRDVLADLVERVRLERELLGVSEVERDVRMAVARAENRYSEQAIQNAMRIIEAERAVIEQRREMERLANFLGSQMEDALMSMVDGTKSVEDAFKDMARAVIAELYRVIVVQRIVGSFGAGGGGLLGALYGGFYPSANGNVFSGGNVVPFADGGVVTRATTFPMQNGGVGLMGEAGPEAILPLKRGPGGKLGVESSGGGGTVVNNNISVTGSDSESVRREITKMIPQISRVTTMAVMDARKRGGAMKSTFG